MVHDARHLRLAEIQAITGLGKTKIYKMIEAGRFPAPVKRGRSSLWPARVIEDWSKRPKPIIIEDLL